MHDEITLEYNIALIPEDSLAMRHISISQQVAKSHPALVTLNDIKPRLALPPHLTLYQVPTRARDLEKMLAMLAALAKSYLVPLLYATKYVYNAGEASFELQYEVTDQLLQLQHEIIAQLTPLRGELLLERDPAGHALRDMLDEKGILGENLRTTGYAEVGDPATGGLFRPHVTLNWLELGTPMDEAFTEALPSLTTLQGRYPRLGVYLLGPYGTCPQRVAQYGLGV